MIYVCQLWILSDDNIRGQSKVVFKYLDDLGLICYFLGRILLSLEKSTLVFMNERKRFDSKILNNQRWLLLGGLNASPSLRSLDNVRVVHYLGKKSTKIVAK